MKEEVQVKNGKIIFLEEKIIFDVKDEKLKLSWWDIIILINSIILLYFAIDDIIHSSEPKLIYFFILFLFGFVSVFYALTSMTKVKEIDYSQIQNIAVKRSLFGLTFPRIDFIYKKNRKRVKKHEEYDFQKAYQKKKHNN